MENKNDVSKNYDYYSNNFEKLYKKYKNKYIALKNCEVIGVYNNFEEAIKETAKTEKLGTFLIQHCNIITFNNIDMYYSNLVL